VSTWRSRQPLGDPCDEPVAQAAALLPAFVATRTEVVEVREVEIP
jgi:hypothetical protein